MKNVKPYVKLFYQALDRGELPGQRCLCCGQVRLTWVPVCDRCKSRDLEEITLKKEGLLTVFSVRQHWDLEKRYQTDFPGQVTVGSVTLSDGPILWCPVEGINMEAPWEDFQRLPLPVSVKIQEVGGNQIPVAVVQKK